MKKFTLIILIMYSWFNYGQSFTDVTGNLPQLATGFSAWGDFDGDGDLDLYYSGYQDVSHPGMGGLYRNDSGTFNLVSNSALPLYDYGEADWGDFDGDGDLDIVIIGYDENNVSSHAEIYLNNANGTFSPANSGMLGVYLGDVHFVDINNDNHLDVAVTGTETSSWTDTTKIYMNDGNGNLTEISTSFPSLNFAKIKFGDYDNDGDMDMLINGKNNTTNMPYVKVWNNDGNGNFTENNNISLSQIWLGDIDWVDVDGDNYLDIFISGTSNTDSEMHLYINDGFGNFNEDTSLLGLLPLHESNVSFDDFDNDGDPDFFISGKNQGLSNGDYYAKLYLNVSGTFTEYTGFSFTGLINGDLDVADYDNNNYPDIFISGNDINGSKVAKLYHNGPASYVESNISDNFSLYPNPANNVLYVNQQNANDDFLVEIYDFSGKNYFRKQIENMTAIDISNFPAGLYLIRISDNDEIYTKKLIIE